MKLIDIKHIHEITQYWFGDDVMTPELATAKANLWFQSNKQIDEEITYRFECLVIQATDGELLEWQDSASGMLALIILLDQFSRNIYRGTEHAFAQDSQARALCKLGIEKNIDQALDVVERSFFYLPLEHSENKDDQALSMKMFKKLYHDADESWKDYTKNSLFYAQEHFDIIHQFGRFPHRNKILGRESTQEEQEYLSENTSAYGQG